jgi:hypothetical protein
MHEHSPEGWFIALLDRHGEPPRLTDHATTEARLGQGRSRAARGGPSLPFPRNERGPRFESGRRLDVGRSSEVAFVGIPGKSLFASPLSLGRVREPDLAGEWLQAACAHESAVGARRQVQRLSVQAGSEVRGGTE